MRLEGDGMDKKQINVRNVPADLLAKAQEQAKKEDRPLSQVIRESSAKLGEAATTRKINTPPPCGRHEREARKLYSRPLDAVLFIASLEGR